MKDVITALMGKKTCGWCVHKDATWWERLTDQDKLGLPKARWKRAAWWVQDMVGRRIPTWRMGQWWHHQFHIAYDDPRKVQDRWVASVKVGDTICNCSCQHLKVTERVDKDMVLLENGTMCDLYHCADAVKDDGSCHGAYMEDADEH